MYLSFRPQDHKALLPRPQGSPPKTPRFSSSDPEALLPLGAGGSMVSEMKGRAERIERRLVAPQGDEDGGWKGGKDGYRGKWGFAEDQEESLGAPPPDGSLMLGGQQEASVVGHDLVFGQVQVELQRHQHRELEGYQLSAVHPEPLFQFLQE
ncbi:hypothetical protein EYF80_022271 [Liparis tanakae]|uniref:Uncharacterized protein n=1 Tax=Liparis tanakae TaxID=230148 RepID=A0A4Z2HQB1_9TELE|nr:hypothetical protein EYF80_022271 [Liparis tanakae]